MVVTLFMKLSNKSNQVHNHSTIQKMFNLKLRPQSTKKSFFIDCKNVLQNKGFICEKLIFHFHMF